MLFKESQRLGSKNKVEIKCLMEKDSNGKKSGYFRGVTQNKIRIYMNYDYRESP